jgi:hypothetical protein
MLQKQFLRTLMIILFFVKVMEKHRIFLAQTFSMQTPFKLLKMFLNENN